MLQDLLTELVENCTEVLDVLDTDVILTTVADAASDINSDLVEVAGYFNADGTWVEPYVRTAADNTIANNLGTWGLQNV